MRSTTATRFGVYFGIVILTMCSSGSLQAAETVRVEVDSGAPRLTVDGQPIRARIFFGRKASRPLRIGPEGRAIRFEFSAADDAIGQSTMHFRFGQLPGEICLDDIRVESLEDESDVLARRDFDNSGSRWTEDWTCWPPEPQNTVGRIDIGARAGRDESAGLRIRLNSPPNGHWPDFHVYHHPNLSLRKGRRYRVTLWARAEPARDLTIAFYRPGKQFTYLGGPPGAFESQIRLAADVGVDLVSFPVHMPWPRPGQAADWSTTDSQCQEVLDANPRALLIPRIGMGAPAWWRQMHPEAVMVWDQPGQEHTDVVVASPVYRRDAAERLRALVAHLEERFGPQMAGYHPCGQNTGEWFYQETWKAPLNGYSKASLEAWRGWLGQRYASDAELRRAWDDPGIELKTAPVPSPESRRAAPHGTLRDPHIERPLIDFAEFQQQMMADCVCRFAAVVRQASAGRKLVVFFYGYVFEFGAIHNGPAVSGHYALRQVLECPDIDLLCSPISYFDRGWGESAPAMTAAESVALAGKMWLYEDDTATHLSTGSFPGRQDRVDTLDQTKALLIRNTAQCAVRNFATWWMDLGGTGWFDDARIWQQMDRLSEVDKAIMQPPRPYRPEIAAVIDEKSMIRVAAGGSIVTRPGIYEARGALARVGSPYGQYLQDDIAAGRVDARMYVFLNAWYTTGAQRTALQQATQGATKIWCYAPGCYDGDAASAESMQSLTGFRLQSVQPMKAWAEPTATGRALGLRQGFGVPQTVQPLFAAADAAPEETLAVYPDGSAAVAMRDTPQGPSVFVGVPRLTSELLRIAARRAGVHLFTDKDCNVYANGPLLVLHASEDGERTIELRQPSTVLDRMSGESVGRGSRILLQLKQGDTRVLQVNPL